MPEYDQRAWRDFLEAKNELEAANEYHISLMNRYTSVTTALQPGRPLDVVSESAKAEIKAAEERLDDARDQLRRAQAQLH